MLNEISKYPYYVKHNDEDKVFISDIIGEQVVKINGQIFCTIIDRITSKEKEIKLSIVIFLVGLF